MRGSAYCHSLFLYNNKKMKKILGLLLIAFLAACTSTPEEKFTLNGTIQGVEDGKKIILKSYFVDNFEPLSAIVENGKFQISGKIDCPHKYMIDIEGISDGMTFAIIYPENTEMTIDWNVEKGNSYEITGGSIQEVVNQLNKKKAEIGKKYNFDALVKEYKENIKNPSEALIKDLMEAQTNIIDEGNKLESDYIKANNSSYYTAIHWETKSGGMSALDMEKMIKEKLDPSLESSPIVKNWRAKIAKLNELDVEVGSLIDAENVNYKTEKSFPGEQYKNVIYLAVFKNNDICALQKDGTVQILNSKGAFVSSFKTEKPGIASSIAINAKDEIYFISRLEKKVTNKIRGRKVEKLVPFGTDCTIYNRQGVEKKHFSLEKTFGATGAKVIGDTLVIADYHKGRLAIHSASTGKQKATIEGMRACCNILDISVNTKNEILVGNLGAFRAEAFDFNGKQIAAFGKRGKGISDFHGCCNPVNVAHLSNGAIVTVEKDPTRIKVYSKEGAKQITGIEELVKGCTYIPMVVDSKDNLYLASKEKGLVKCVSVN